MRAPISDKQLGRAVVLMAGGLGAAWGAPPVFAQPTTAPVAIQSPPPEAVLGWGSEAPVLTIAARLEAPEAVATRVFLTANVLEGSRVVDGVRLYDDGSHGDTHAADGVFTAQYRPPEPRSYSVRVRAQWDGSRGSREGWSAAVPFHVERIPYPRLVFPEPGGRVGRSADVRARLLIGSSAYGERDPSLRVEARTSAPSDAAQPTPQPGRRNGTVVVAPVRFEGLGPRLLSVTVSVERRGARLEATDGPVAVDVANPPVAFFWVAAALALAYLLLPPRRPVPRYRHEIIVKDRQTRATVARGQLESDVEGPVRKTLGPEGSDIVVPGAAGQLCALIAFPAKRALQAEAANSGLLQVGQGQQASATLQPSPGKVAFSLAGISVIYEDAVATAGRRFPLWYPTAPKVAVLALALLAFGWAVWQRIQFYQQ